MTCRRRQMSPVAGEEIYFTSWLIQGIFLFKSILLLIRPLYYHSVTIYLFSKINLQNLHKSDIRNLFIGYTQNSNVLNMQPEVNKFIFLPNPFRLSCHRIILPYAYPFGCIRIKYKRNEKYLYFAYNWIFAWTKKKNIYIENCRL